MYKEYFDDIDGILAGCLLGDGSIDNNDRYIRMSHTNAQRSYVIFKYNLFLGLGCVTNKRMDYWRNTNLGRVQYSETVVLPPNLHINHMSVFDLVSIVNPIGLLLWWLDDGCLSIHHKNNGTSVSRFGYLNTQALDYVANEEVSRILLNRFGLMTSIHMDKGSGFKGTDCIYYRLYLNATNMRLLIDIVRPFIHMIPNDMLYKLNMAYIPNKLSISQEYALKYNF